MEAIAKTIDSYRDLIVDTLDYIWKNPETGYREWKTNKYMAETFKKLGYDIVEAGDIPGFYTVIDTGRPGPEILILGELDSLLCKTHPDADPETGAVHCCGHAAQCAALVGIAAALKNPEILDRLSGRIRLCAVPAEELIEIGYRSELKTQGKIRYFGGKPEFLYRGYFDGVDLAFMVHTTSGEDFAVNAGCVGCVAKKVMYKGTSAHAGGSPWNGCNALYAANLGLSGINAIRETFKEPDIIRVHPIITQGGTAVNAIPETICIESYVRGSSFEAIRSANDKVNRALCGGALAIGANVDIQDIPGYAPLHNDKNLVNAAAEALQKIFPDMELKQSDGIGSGSTDMGDLSCIMPVMHPHAPGAKGTSHGDNYYIENPDLACLGSAKWQVALAVLLLENGGKRAKEIIDAYEPLFASAKDYLAYLDSFDYTGDRISYNEDGTANVRLKKTK
ncbi:MAG: amidohydrolase [Clostridia bacterium]|nr:amidohydrolase [Clostridia bacterium]